MLGGFILDDHDNESYCVWKLILDKIMVCIWETSQFVGQLAFGFKKCTHTHFEHFLPSEFFKTRDSLLSMRKE